MIIDQHYCNCTARTANYTATLIFTALVYRLTVSVCQLNRKVINKRPWHGYIWKSILSYYCLQYIVFLCTIHILMQDCYKSMHVATFLEKLHHVASYHFTAFSKWNVQWVRNIFSFIQNRWKWIWKCFITLVVVCIVVLWKWNVWTVMLKLKLMLKCIHLLTYLLTYLKSLYHPTLKSNRKC